MAKDKLSSIPVEESPAREGIGLTRELDYNQILFRHINRMGIYIADVDIYPTKFTSGVKFLKALMIPYIDKKYKKRMEIIEKSYLLNKRAIIQRDGKPEPSKLTILEIDKAMMEFKAMMELMGRKGLLPRESVEMEI